MIEMMNKGRRKIVTDTSSKKYPAKSLLRDRGELVSFLERKGLSPEDAEFVAVSVDTIVEEELYWYIESLGI